MGDLHGYAIPVVSLDSDDGFGVGLRGEVYRERDGYDPYREAWMAHAHLTTTGYQHHRLRYDRVWLHGRFTANVAYRKWLNSQWYGLGNATTQIASDDPKFERYVLQQPFARLTVRRDVVEPLELFVAGDLDVTSIRTYAGSRLEADAPHGMDGGPQVELHVGAIIDTREPEISPERGVFTEVSGRIGARLPMIEPRGEMYGAMAVFRGYQTLSPGVTLAGRVMAERLWGDVPFYEMTHWGGSTPIVGVGGGDTLRGLPFDRYHGPGHAVANLELRTHVTTVQVFRAPLELELVPSVDAGIVWGAPTADPGPDALPVHPGFALGGRAVYDMAFVGRVDFGLAPDQIREGDVTRTFLNWGFYLAFDHTF